MPRLTILTNAKPAAAIGHGGLEFVWTTTLLPRKDNSRDLVPDCPTARKRSS